MKLWYSADNFQSAHRTIDYLELRRNIGLIGLALPLLLPLTSGAAEWLIEHLTGEDQRIRTWLGSMSAYYYSYAGTVFTGGLITIGIFLLSYQGYDHRDANAGNIACVAALMVALFPMFPPGCEHGGAGIPTSLVDVCSQVNPASEYSQYPHYGGAVILFAVLAWFCLKSFVKTANPATMTREKKKRNKVYRVCGWVIIGTMALAGACMGLAAWLGADSAFARLLEELRVVYVGSGGHDTVHKGNGQRNARQHSEISGHRMGRQARYPVEQQHVVAAGHQGRTKAHQGAACKVADPHTLRFVLKPQVA